MPVHRGNENGKLYYQYGTHGKKYYYKRGDKISRDLARNLALKQQKAVHAQRSFHVAIYS